MATTEIAEQVLLPDVLTGEQLPATPVNARRVLLAAREMKQLIQGVIDSTTEYLLEESRRLGTKTFHTSEGDVVLSGGPSRDYDAHRLAELLLESGCPQERVDEVVKAEVTYKIDRSVLRQLVGANPDYAAAAELSQIDTLKPYRASAK